MPTAIVSTQRTVDAIRPTYHRRQKSRASVSRWTGGIVASSGATATGGSPALACGMRRAERLNRVSIYDRLVALSPDQHADNQDVENIGADADRKRGGIISEMVVKQTGEPAAGGHVAAAEQQQGRNPPRS